MVGGSGTQLVRVGLVAAALVCFFLMFSRTLTLAGTALATPWGVLVDILVYAGLGMFFVCFAFLLSRLAVL